VYAFWFVWKYILGNTGYIFGNISLAKCKHLKWFSRSLNVINIGAIWKRCHVPSLINSLYNVNSNSLNKQTCDIYKLMETSMTTATVRWKHWWLKQTCASNVMTQSPWVPSNACDALTYKSALYANICNCTTYITHSTFHIHKITKHHLVQNANNTNNSNQSPKLWHDFTANILYFDQKRFPILTEWGMSIAK